MSRIAELIFGRRSVENPTVPVSPTMLDSLMSYGPTRSGVQVNEQTAMTFAAVFAAVRILSDAVGMLPLVLYHQEKRGKTKAVGHPIYDLLRFNPNKEMTASVFKETLQGHLVLWGNAYARIKLNRAGIPIELIPMLPDRTFAERQGGKLRYKTEMSETFAPEEILHLPGLGFNGIAGYSPIAYTREAIALGLAAQIFGATFFGNGAHMGGVLTHPGHLSPEAVRNLRESFEAKFRGSANANRPAILEEGMKWEAIGIPPDDAQFLETRKFQILEIARIFRVPPHMLADLERATFSNIEQQGMDFVTYSLQPWLEKWEQEIKRKLLAGTDLVARFDLRQILRGDTTARFQGYATARQWGWMSANDIREAEDENLLPPEQGDTYLTPLNMNAATEGQKPPALPAEPPVAEPKPGQAGTPAPQQKPAADAARSGVIDLMALELRRMLKREGNAMKKAAERNDADGWERSVRVSSEGIRESMKLLAASCGRVVGSDGTPGAAIATRTIEELLAQGKAGIAGGVALATQLAQEWEDTWSVKLANDVYQAVLAGKDAYVT